MTTVVRNRCVHMFLWVLLHLVIVVIGKVLDFNGTAQLMLESCPVQGITSAGVAQPKGLQPRSRAHRRYGVSDGTFLKKYICFSPFSFALVQQIYWNLIRLYAPFFTIGFVGLIVAALQAVGLVIFVTSMLIERNGQVAKNSASFLNIFLLKRFTVCQVRNAH